MTDPHAIDTAIAALEAQRALLGDAAVDAGLAVLREKLGATTQQLRHVTVLFLDVVGSTELSHRLDPEDMHAVLDGLLTRATATVQAFQGKVLQYAGDSLLAVFGRLLRAEHGEQ
ncbi:MAG: adenylate/guanylate cyclase domain-containing protein, partial [Burkholderiaceae bacterium]